MKSIASAVSLIILRGGFLLLVRLGMGLLRGRPFINLAMHRE